MSDASTPTSTGLEATRVAPVRRAPPTWWVVFLNEARGLWIGGKAPILILLFSIVLGVHAFVTAYNVELSLMPPKEMVFETVRTAIAIGIFLGMIIGADAISGERERGALEALLLTPTRRRQIVVGKLLAALTPWPVILLLTIPYAAVLAQGDEVLVPALAWGAAVGSVLAIAYTATGVLVSFWSNSNRTSYLVSMGIYILILVPSQLPGPAQKGAAGKFLQRVNPVAATEEFLEKILVNNRTLEEYWAWLLSPVIFALVVLALLLVFSAPGLRLEAGRSALVGRRWRSALARITGLFMVLVPCLLLATGTALANADRRSPAIEGLAADGEAPVDVTVDVAYQTVSTGDAVFFDTVVTNPHQEASPPLILAMNIVNLNAEGDIVDPEDWSPERTQYVDQLGPGESTTLSWRVNAILDGDFMVYMVVLPEPAGPDATSQAVASSGIHLTVSPFTRLNPRGVIPLVVGAPIVLGAGAGLIMLNRRRETDGSGGGNRLLRLPAVGAGVVVALAALSAVAVASQGGGPSGPLGSSAQPSAGAGDAPVALEVDTGSGPEDFFYVEADHVAPAGSTISLTLNNRTSAADEIGHNWVLVQPGAEQSVLENGINAGDEADWLDVDDPGIIAHTALIEGETSDTVTFAAPPPGTYTFLCTFPEHHAGGMVGTLTIEGS